MRLPKLVLSPCSSGVVTSTGRTFSPLSPQTYLFFHPPRCPGAPPLERGAGPNPGPDWRESVGWKILLPLVGSVSSGLGLRGLARLGRKGRDSGPCISSRWGLWILEGSRLVDPPPRPRERASLASDPARGEGEGAPVRGEAEEPPPRIGLRPFFIAAAGRGAGAPLFFVPAWGAS